MERIKENESETINILIVDDHQMLIDGIQALLKKEKHFQFIATANSGEKALELLKTIHPNLVITDINMPGMSGIELTKHIKTHYNDIKVLVLTMHNERAIISEILKAEAEGYILKNTGREELINAIHKIADGGTFFSSDVIASLMKETKSEVTEQHLTPEKAGLTPREIEIIKLIADEFSSAQIAEKLFISPRTVDTHRKHILEKIQCKTVVGLLKFAYANHLVE